MNSVRGNATGLSFNCHLCDSGDLPIGQYDKRQVKASCPDSHVFHWKCITKWFDSEQQATKSLGTRKCSQCKQQAEPFILMSGDTVPGKYSSYCKSLDTPVFKDNTGRAKNDPSLGKMDKQGNTTLHEAVLRGSKEKVEAILRDTSSLNLVKMKNNQGETAFDMAVRRNQAKIVEVFMKKDETLAWKDGSSALHKAVESNSTETVKVLLTIAPALDKFRNKKDNKTALQIATDKGYTKTVNVFKEFTASLADHEKGNSTLTTNMKLDDTDKADKTAQAGSVVTNDPVPTDTADDSRKKPLNDSPDTNPTPRELTKTESSTNSRNKALDDYVAENDDFKCLEYLTNKKVTIHDADESGKTALHHAAEKGHSHCLACLLKYEANINTKDNSGKTALHHAAEKGHSKCLNELSEGAADYNALDNSGKTALHHAAEKGHYECLKKLLEVGAKYNTCDKSGKTALYYAISEKITLQQYVISAGDKARLEAYKQCLDKLCDMKDIERKNVSHVLRFAIEENYDIQSIEKLFDQADLTVQIEEGKTLLHVAAENGNDRYLKKFLEKKDSEESIAIKDDKDRTPLHYAALKASSNFIEMLMYEEYEEYEENSKKDPKLREIIREKCIDEKDKNGDTPLLLAAQNNGLACIEKLIKAKANVRLENNSGMGLLHFIAGSVEKENKYKLLNFLLKHNHIKIKNVTEHGDKDSYTPLQHAAYHGNFDFVKTIREFEKPERFPVYKKSNQHKKEVDSKLTIDVRDPRKAPSLLELAIQGDQNDFLMLVLKLKETNDEEEEFKNTLSRSFLYAAVHGKYRCLKNISEVYKGKLNVNYQVGGKSALHYIVADECWLNNNKTQNVSQVIKSYRLCFDFLLKHGELKINLRNEEGMTPLHLAAKAKNIQCLATLLDQKKIGIFNKDKPGEGGIIAEDVTEDPECKKALEEAKERDKAKNPPRGPDYYLNTYFKIPNDQDSSEDYFADPIGPYIHYQEKLFGSNNYYQEHDFTSILKCDFKSMSSTEIRKRCFMNPKQISDFYKNSFEETLNYFSVAINELQKREKSRVFHGYHKFFEGKTNLHEPVHYVNSIYMNNLILDNIAYGFQDTKKRIIDHLHTYEKIGFHFTAKKNNPSDSNEPKVYVNISLCHEDIGLGDLARKCTQRLLLGSVDSLLEPIKDILTDKLQKIVSGVISGSLNIINELKEIDIEECAKILTRKWKEDKTEDIDEQMESEAKECVKGFLQKLEGKCGDIKSEKFTVCSGSRSLLSNIKKNEKIRIELDRNESSNSPWRNRAHFQFKSNDSQVTFKELAEVLEELLK